MLAVLSIDYFRLCSLQNTFVLKFHVNSQDDTGYKYMQLREQMQNLLMAYVAQEAAGSYKETGYFYLILNTLLAHFTAQQSGSDSGQDRSEQVMKILHYIHMNYAENLGLNEVRSTWRPDHGGFRIRGKRGTDCGSTSRHQHDGQPVPCSFVYRGIPLLPALEHDR